MVMENKRMTVFPGTTTASVSSQIPQTKDAKQSRQQSLTTDSIQDLKTPLRHGRSIPPVLPIKVNPSLPRQNTQSGPFPLIEYSNTAWKKTSPWKKYRATMVEGEDGATILAQTQDQKQEVVIIKQSTCQDETTLRRLTQYGHENLVKLYETYLDRSILFFVYERMEVSLAEMSDTPAGPFEESQIATICVEVIPLHRVPIRR